MKPPELSTRKLPPLNPPVQNFLPELHSPGSLTLPINSVVTDFFNPKSACTVRYIVIQTTGLNIQTRITLLLNGVPISPALQVANGTILRFPGMILPNNCKLSFSCVAANTLNFDVVWVKDFQPSLIVEGYDLDYNCLDQDGQFSVNIGTFANPPIDNLPNVVSYVNVGSPPLTYVGNAYHGGLFSGTTDAVRRNFNKARTPTVFRTVSATALGSTAIWTPGAGNKVRLLKYCIQLTADASLAVAGHLIATFLDAAVATNLTHEWFVPAAALAANNYEPINIDLGFFGMFSTAANNVLNISLGTALATGSLRVTTFGVED